MHSQYENKTGQTINKRTERYYSEIAARVDFAHFQQT